MIVSIRQITFALVLLAGCSHTAYPPLDGLYVTEDGISMGFRQGIYSGDYPVGVGKYSVDGNHVVLHTHEGTLVEGDRLDADTLHFTKKNGQATTTFEAFRDGTPKALAAKQAAIDQKSAKLAKADVALAEQKAKEASAVAASTFQPDLSVPISSYTPIKTPQDLALLSAAWSAKPWSDEDLLKRLSPNYVNETDAFRRHDIAERDLPSIKSRLEADRAQHYYSGAISSPDFSQPALPILVLIPFDLDQKAFTIYSQNGRSCWFGFGGTVEFSEKSSAPCVFPVTDMELARKIESMRAHNQIRMAGTAYFCVTRAGGQSPIAASVTHVHLAIGDASDPSFHYETDL